MANVGDVIVRLRGDTAEFQRRMRQADKSLESLGTRAKRTGERLASIGTSVSLGLTAPIVAAAAATTKVAQTFDREITKINTLVGISKQQTDQWASSIRELGVATGRGPTELARAMFVVTSAGARGTDAFEILTNAAKASAIGLGETATIARTVTAAMQAYGTESLSAERATDILTATVREGNLEASELAGSLGRVIGIAAQVGVSFNELGAFIATFTRLGVDSAEATTALRGVLSTIIKPSTGAQGALESVGLSIEKVRDTIQKRGLTFAMLQLAEAFRGNVDGLGELIPNIRALSGFLGTAGRQAEAFEQISKNVAESQQITANAFDVVADKGFFTFDQLKAKVEDLAIEMGQGLAPAMDSLFESLSQVVSIAKGAVQAFAALPTPLQTIAFAVTAIGAAIGPVLFVIGNLMKAFGGLLTAARAIPIVMAAIAGVIGTGGILPIAIGVLAVSVVGIIAKFVSWGDAADDTQEKLKKLSKVELGTNLGDLRQKIKSVERELEGVENQLDSVRRGTSRHAGLLVQRNELERQLTELLKEETALEERLAELRTQGQTRDKGKPTPAGGGGAGVKKEAEEIKAIFESLDESMRVARARFDAFGGGAELLEEQLAANMRAFEALIAEGVDPTDQRVQDLIVTIDDLQEELTVLEGANLKATGSLNKTEKKIKDTNAQLKGEVHQLGGIFTGFVGEIVRGTDDIGSAFERMGQRILDMLLNLALQHLTTQVVGGDSSTGGGILGILSSVVGAAFGGFGGGATASAGASSVVGTSLDFAAASARNFADFPQFASGGAALKPMVAEIGHGPRGEIVAPIDKVPGLISDALKRSDGINGAGTRVSMTVVTRDADSFRKSKPQILSEMNRAVKVGSRGV